MATTPELLTAERAEPSRRSAGVALRGSGMPLMLVVLALFAVAGWSRRWNGDDAFIVFRVVDNVLSGDGAVYNVGERVEAVTSVLWLAVLVAARALTPLPVAWLAVLIGLACAVTGLGRRGSAPAAGRSPGSPRTTMTVADRATSTPRA